MARIKYYYDTETCKYERVKTKTSDVVLNALGLLALLTLIAAGLVSLGKTYFPTPNELVLKNKLVDQEFYLTEINRKIKGIEEIVEGIEVRDDNIYRVVLGAEPIDKSVRNAGIGGSDRYADIRDKKLANGDLVLEISEKIDLLKRKLYIESKSQDELARLAENKEKLFAAIPAIQPISNKQLMALASGFGMRTHPIYKVKKMHSGIDFAAAIGTPIYATADGKVLSVDVKFSGYGKLVEIDHGFGYRTRYAHLTCMNLLCVPDKR
jgi:murein DD-endopeptidase MepM/ murein hydrolase activator NlpD